MASDSKIVSVQMDEELVDDIDGLCCMVGVERNGDAPSRSEWIRTAVEAIHDEKSVDEMIERLEVK